MEESPKIPEHIKLQLSVLPENPGVYQYSDSNGTIIYVGKAKNLKKRVSSYFVKSPSNRKTALLVKKIHTINYIVVNSEADALLLENTLIKKHQPRYNVLLKDDKTYPWICIKNEAFPRLLYTRNFVKDGSTYYGPYTNIRMIKTLLNFIRQLYQIRTCKLNLEANHIAQGKYAVCLEYHIHNCKGPCIGNQTEIDYAESIADIKNILKGNIGQVTSKMKSSMLAFANDLKFEEAQKVKEKLELLENYQSKSTVVSPSINNVDVYSILDDGDAAYVNFLKISNGAIIQSHILELKKRLDEPVAELLEIGITEIRQRIASNSPEIIVPFKPEFNLGKARFVVPQKGEKKQLLELSERNLKFYKAEKSKQLEKIDPERHTKRILERLKNDLQLDSHPLHIECFDNSNIQGTHPVSACVVFKNTKPSKKDYRHFNIKTVEGPNDFASMEEVLRRRYTRLIREKEQLPNLVIVDGGKGQLSSAVSIFKELGIFGQVALIGIAKRLEEIFFPGDPIPLYLDKNSESLKVIQHLRNEAHRFCITHHRNKRSKAFITSELTSIEGIGPTTSQNLLSSFKSIESIKNATKEEIANVIGNSKAILIWDYFHPKSN